MEQRIKLRPKQLDQLVQIQTQKQNINKLFQDLNQREGLLVDLIIEEANVVSKVINIKLDKEELVLTLAPQNPGKQKKKKIEKQPLAG